MSRAYDASLKDLIEKFPADWLELTGLGPTTSIRVIDADLSTITAAADKVLQIQGTPSWQLHLELQSSPKSGLTDYLLWYNTLLGHRHDQHVRTVLVLLRPTADSPQLSGIYRKQFPGESPYLEFHYRVIRVWQQPVENLLTGPLGTLPLGPISAVAEADLPMVVRRIDARLEKEAGAETRAVLGAATFVLTGLRLPPEAVLRLYQGVRFMSIIEDSSAYQIILEKGRAQGKKEGAIEELRATIVRQGQKRFGQPDAATLAALQGIADLGRLEQISERLLDVGSWPELLATS